MANNRLYCLTIKNLTQKYQPNSFMRKGVINCTKLIAKSGMCPGTKLCRAGPTSLSGDI